MPAQATTTKAGEKPAPSTEKPKASAPPQEQEEEEEEESENEKEETEDQAAAKRAQKILDYKTNPIFRIRKEGDYDAAVEKGGLRLIATAWYFRFKGEQTDEFMLEMIAINGPPVGVNVVQHHREQVELQKFNAMLTKAYIPAVSGSTAKGSAKATDKKKQSKKGVRRNQGQNQPGGRNAGRKGIWIST